MLASGTGGVVLVLVLVLGFFVGLFLYFESLFCYHLQLLMLTKCFMFGNSSAADGALLL